MEKITTEMDDMRLVLNMLRILTGSALSTQAVAGKYLQEKFPTQAFYFDRNIKWAVEVLEENGHPLTGAEDKPAE